MENNAKAARYFGAFFILTFLAYGVGSTMTNAVTSQAGFLSQLVETKQILIAGVLLMAVVHTVLNIGLAAIMFGILTSVNRFVAAAYFGLAIAGTTVLVVGTVFLLLLLPLQDLQNNTLDADTLAVLLKRGAFYCYQLGMALWGFAGLLLVALLLKSALLPKGLLLFGAFGYVVFVFGTTAEIFGFSIGTILSLPGGLFEISLSIWLLTKGFNKAALSHMRP